MKTLCLLPIAYCLLTVPHFHDFIFSKGVASAAAVKVGVVPIFEKQFSAYLFFKEENSFSKNLDSRPAQHTVAENKIMEKLPKQPIQQNTQTTVVHCKKSEFDVYIGRPGKWGNPFTLKSGYTREQAITEYRKWIVKQYDLLSDLKELKGKRLGCWCKPQSCHGDVLVELIEKLVSDDDEEELPFEIQIMTCSDHYAWYELSVYEKFQVVAINDDEQTYTVVAYDAYGRETFEEVLISDCKILNNE